MARTLVVLAAILVGVASWYALVYLFRYSGVTFLQSLTYWISPLSFTGWLLCAVLIGIYYWVFSSIWLPGRATGI